ncbi:MAG: hypothetical protein MUC35_01635 [Candidatus Margulisbacteria bacterium]|jgi:hypothetical protein|nr:hypothetical protein [Candidatus Margulisiibacteriota bacterium]
MGNLRITLSRLSRPLLRAAAFAAHPMLVSVAREDKFSPAALQLAKRLKPLIAVGFSNDRLFAWKKSALLLKIAKYLLAENLALPPSGNLATMVNGECQMKDGRVKGFIFTSFQVRDQFCRLTEPWVFVRPD